MNYYIQALKKYAVFNGRATRSEYWFFFLFNILISIAIGLVVGILGESVDFLNSIYSLAVLLPSLAVGVRRLHDTGRSGWWYLLALIPIVGWIVLLVFLAEKSGEGSNKYGSSVQVEAPKMSSL